MADPYRVVTRGERVVIAGRLRLRATPAILALLVATFGLSFSTISRMTMSCKRTQFQPSVEIECMTTEAGSWTRTTKRTTLHAPKPSRLERQGNGHRLIVPTADGDVVLWWSAIDSSQLDVMVGESLEAVRNWSAQGVSRAGKVVLDLRVLIPCALATLALIFLSMRRRRIIVDHARSQVIAMTTVASVPWLTTRVPFAHRDGAASEKVEGRHRIVVGSRVLLEADENDEEPERLAARIADAIA